LHALSSDDAMKELIKYPGIGPKTASCVLLFCMQRPSFAVDTHVFRLCRWLDWVPPKATRNSAYSHCEVRVPDHLKYALHQLFIRHGKTCPRCRAATSVGSEGWDKGCPIDHLVKRTGKRKDPTQKAASAAKKGEKKKKNRKQRRPDDEDDVESSSEEEEEVAEEEEEEEEEEQEEEEAASDAGDANANANGANGKAEHDDDAAAGGEDAATGDAKSQLKPQSEKGESK
jgi:adenine-specific DNA glycosylase